MDPLDLPETAESPDVSSKSTDQLDLLENAELLENKESKESLDTTDIQESKETKDQRETTEPRDPKETLVFKEKSVSKDPLDPRDLATTVLHLVLPQDIKPELFNKDINFEFWSQDTYSGFPEKLLHLGVGAFFLVVVNK